MGDDIITRIRSGEFKTKLPYPARVKEPALLRKSVKELTDVDVETIPAVKAAYAADKAAYDAAAEAYRLDSGKREEAFVAALHEYHGMTGHPKADMLFSKANEYGHSAGHEEVANHYDDLVDLAR